MKITKESLEKRVDTSLTLDDDVYSVGILDMIHLLYIELSKLLENEGRMFGIMPKYMDIVQDAFDVVESDMSDDDYELYGRFMYLFKPIIFRAYRKLRKKKVSKADCIITIIKALLDYLRATTHDIYKKELKTIYKITFKMFSNIKNEGKNTSISFVTEAIQYYRDDGLTGLYSLDKFSIEDEEKKREKTKLEGTGIRVDDNVGISEVSWVLE